MLTTLADSAGWIYGDTPEDERLSATLFIQRINKVKAVRSHHVEIQPWIDGFGTADRSPDLGPLRRDLFTIGLLFEGGTVRTDALRSRHVSRLN